MAINRRLLLVALLAAWGTGFCARGVALGGQTSSAAKRLLKSMEKSRYVCCSAILLNKHPSEGVHQVKLEQSGSGHVKYTVMTPLSEQGIVSVDDGQLWKTYNPNTAVMMVQESAKKGRQSPTEQIKLAEKNYTFTLQSSDKIAGREVEMVHAKSKHSGMPERRFYIDKQNNFLLRIEVKKGSSWDRLSDTIAVSYPSRLKSSTFTITPVSGFRTNRQPSPEVVKDPEKIKSYVGFVPITPKSLPMGFKVQTTHVVGGEHQRFIAVRLTDGLEMVTVYQWDDSFGDDPIPSGTTKDKRVNGVSLRFVGDIPSSFGSKVLDAFVKTALEGLKTLHQTLPPQFVEPALVPNPLNGTHGPQKAPVIDPNFYLFSEVLSHTLGEF